MSTNDTVKRQGIVFKMFPTKGKHRYHYYKNTVLVEHLSEKLETSGFQCTVDMFKVKDKETRLDCYEVCDSKSMETIARILFEIQETMRRIFPDIHENSNLDYDLREIERVLQLLNYSVEEDEDEKDDEDEDEKDDEDEDEKDDEDDAQMERLRQELAIRDEKQKAMEDELRRVREELEKTRRQLLQQELEKISFKAIDHYRSLLMAMNDQQLTDSATKEEDRKILVNILKTYGKQALVDGLFRKV